MRRRRLGADTARRRHPTGAPSESADGWRTWGDTQNVIFVKDGDKCLEYPQSPGQAEPALLGSPADYTAAPTGTNAVIADARDQSAPGCNGTPQTDPITTNIAPGGFGYVFLYSTGATDLKGFFLPPKSSPRRSTR